MVDGMKSLKDTVYDYMVSQREERRDTEAWHCSGVNHCYRQRIIVRDGLLPLVPLAGQKLLSFDYGNMVERAVVRAFSSSCEFGTYHHEKIKVPHLDLVGTLDVKCVWPNGRRKVVDIKTANATSFDWNKRLPNEGYRMQCTSYCMGLELKGETVHESSIFYVDKEYAEIMEDVFDWHEYIHKVEIDLKTVQEMWEQYLNSHQLPPEEPFIVASPRSKHVQSGRAKSGEMVPMPLCSPAYCECLPHCENVKAFWDRPTKNQQGGK